MLIDTAGRAYDQLPSNVTQALDKVKKKEVDRLRRMIIPRKKVGPLADFLCWDWVSRIFSLSSFGLFFLQTFA